MKFKEDMRGNKYAKRIYDWKIDIYRGEDDGNYGLDRWTPGLQQRHHRLVAVSSSQQEWCSAVHIWLVGAGVNPSK